LDERAPGQTAAIEQTPLAPCFEACLGSLSDTSRNLALEYYAAERQEKITNRRRLAAALGISESALRSRVQRIRDHLGQCTRHCVEDAESGGLSDALRHVPTVSDSND
jgi:DNA-directed RNA polymerase specialized sigma24 family protein